MYRMFRSISLSCLDSSWRISRSSRKCSTLRYTSPMKSPGMRIAENTALPFFMDLFFRPAVFVCLEASRFSTGDFVGPLPPQEESACDASEYRAPFPHSYTSAVQEDICSLYSTLENGS